MSKSATTSQDPQTPEEWQIAVDTAEILLMLDAAKTYGLVEGGPIVDMARCHELLQRGAALGIRPDVNMEKIRDFLLGCEAGSADRKTTE